MSIRTFWLSLVALLLLLALTSALAAHDLKLALGLGACACLLLAWWLAYRVWRPYHNQIEGLSTLVAAWRDQDFSASIKLPKEPQLRELTVTLNALGDALRGERQALVQRELLLDTVIQNTPTAMVLLDNRERVVYGNLAARELLTDGHKMEGLDWHALVRRTPEALAVALASQSDGLHTLQLKDTEEVFHISRHAFRLQARPHQLILLRRLTRELARAEVATWKKVIRVISHELNNSLAPISSLSHSARELLARGQHQRVDQVLASMGERAQNLGEFISGYARIAKLPQARLEGVAWQELIDNVRQEAEFQVCGALPSQSAQLDRAQCEQLLLNLVKNAREAGSPADQIELTINQQANAFLVELRDRGSGMSPEVLTQALLPFYSTKRSGSGLGLALAREIMEAHGGSIQLVNREGGGLRVLLRFPR